jgi:DNA-binding NarL/FixJ family response regulator
VRAHLARLGLARARAEVFGPQAAAAAVSAYRSGSTLVEVAAGSVGTRAVRRTLADAGVGLRRPGQRGDGFAARHGEVMALRAEGWSFARIGEAFGVGASTVHDHVAAAG